MYNSCELRKCRPLTSPANGNIKCQRHPNAFPISHMRQDIDYHENLTNVQVKLIYSMSMVILICTHNIYDDWWLIVFVSHDTWTLNAPCHVTKDIVWLVRKQEYVFQSPYGLAFRHPVNVRTAKTNYILDLKNFLSCKMCSIFN